jgi:predicted deacetylase
VAVHVSIHDVSPAWQDEVELALETAHAHGVKPALLVVPDFHGRASLADHPEYCERLRELQSSGHEIYLHGYYHQARTWSQRRAETSSTGATHAETGAVARAKHLFAQKVVSGGEAEFSDVSHDEALRRLDEGERMLRDAGLAIQGFVAPAWSMPAWVHALLADRGYSFTEDHTRVYDPSKRRSRASVVLNYASRTPGRLLSSVAWCRIARRARRVLPARIAIHPADMKYALLRGEIESLLAWGEGDFVETGAALLA